MGSFAIICHANKIFLNSDLSHIHEYITLMFDWSTHVAHVATVEASQYYSCQTDDPS